MLNLHILPKNKILASMIYGLSQAPRIYHPSNFWSVLGQQHLNELDQQGFKNFKRTINTRYFNWRILGIIRHQLIPLFYCFLKVNSNPFTKSSFSNSEKSNKSIYGFNIFSAFIYKIYVAALAEYVLNVDKKKLLQNLREPKIGNPFIINYKNYVLSQDICNSVYEFYSITDHINLKLKANIAELGAGYGRLAYVFLKTRPQVTYTIIDIPPALYISQKYLTNVFRKEKVFKYRPFKTFASIKTEFESARIRFLLPNQLEQIPNKYFDLFINISSLHEMNRSQINNFFKLINKTCFGYFYSKQWRKSRTSDNQFITENDYPLPNHWKEIFYRIHPIQRMFFDALYKI